MNLSLHLDVDLVAVESTDSVSLLLELTAPPGDAERQRAPSTLEVVLDRSGSMHGERLAAAKGALDRLIGRLDARDRLGVVTFDDAVDVVIPAAPVADKHALRQRIAAIESGNMTNLSSGYLRGIQEAARASDGAGATLLLLSDGHANTGVTDGGALGDIARRAAGNRIATSTLGIGLDYDEALMSTIARGGSGNALFAEEPDTAGAMVAGEVDGLLDQVVQAASLLIRPAGEVAGITLFNDLPAQTVPGGVMIELGDFYAAEQRKLVLTLDVPAMPALGLAQVAELELSYVELPSLKAHTVTAPVHVNVVPGDEAAGRIPDPVVRTELAYQRAQESKRRAGEALRRRDVGEAHTYYSAAAEALSVACAEAPDDLAQELREEAGVLGNLAERALHDDARRVSKHGEMDRAAKSRRRGGRGLR